MQLIIIVLFAGFLCSAGALVRTMLRNRNSRNDPAARFRNGHEGVFLLLVTLACACLLCSLLATCPPWPEAVGVAVLVNLLTQPIAFLCGWMGVRKVAFGMVERVDYARGLIAETDKQKEQEHWHSQWHPATKSHDAVSYTHLRAHET